MRTRSIFAVAAFVAATIGWGVSSPAVAQEDPSAYGVDRQALIDAAENLGVEFDPETLTVPVEGFEEGASEGLTPRASIVKVPSNYIYNPSRGSLHDYCTKSPDEFPNPFGKNAPFHGPCAIHDMCIERAGYRNRVCDAPLKNNMKTNCRATDGAGPVRTSCEATADVYYAAVTAASYF